MPSVIGAAWHGAATLAAPGLRLMLRRRVKRGKEIAGRLDERRGVDSTQRPAGHLVWLHAASVGETMSILPVIEALRRQAPGTAVLVTTGTVTSARLFAQRCPDVPHRFVPLDVPRWAARFLDHWRPDAAAFVESELWPNLLAACRSRGIGLMLLNARLSPRSAAGWARAPAFAREVIGSFDCIMARSDADAARFTGLGGRGVTAAGDLKFAAGPLPADPHELARLQPLLGTAWLAAATHPGEEAVAAEVHGLLSPRHPGLVTVVAPRHPERGAAIGKMLRATCRSAGADPLPGIWIADTMGELGLLYRLVPIVFIGKSLAGHGGQSPIEAARLGCAVATGPNMANFADAAAALKDANALARVDDAASLAEWVDTMLRDPVRRAAAGEAARSAVAKHAGLPGVAASCLLGLVRD
jgi:3-deoxy-D-manno-octulosonic-acid transferase